MLHYESRYDAYLILRKKSNIVGFNTLYTAIYVYQVFDIPGIPG